MNANLLYCFICFVLLQVGAWFSTNLQLAGYPASKTILVATLLAFQRRYWRTMVLSLDMKLLERHGA